MNKILDTFAVVLCGGKSSRMQEDKSLLPFANSNTLIEYQYKKYQEIFNRVYISAKEKKIGSIDDKYFIQDDSVIHSPMVALQSILKNIESEYVFIVAVDIPLIEIGSVYALYQETLKSKSQIIIAKDTQGNRHNLCGFFHKSILPIIDRLLEKDIHKISELFHSTIVTEVVFEDADQFININRKEDYQKACSFL